MRILQVVQHLHKLSGVSVFCAEACEALSSIGVNVDVAVQDLSDSNCIASKSGARRLQVSDVCNGRCEYDVVHIHNLWTPVLHKAAVWARKNNVPVVWSLHGTLSPWAFMYKWWKKIPAWFAFQRRDIKGAAILHVTSQCEDEWVRKFGFKNIVNIPMGTTIPEEIPQEAREHTLLFVGRIAPVKALPKLIEAWARADRKDWKFRIVGVEDFAGYTDSLKCLAKDLGVEDSVGFVGPKFGKDLENEYRRASALALVSETENFGAVVADAMAYGLPVITSKGTLWSEVVDEKCGWWVDNSPNSLQDVITELISLSDDERLTMGQKGRALVARKYSWSAIADKMKECYESVIRR